MSAETDILLETLDLEPLEANLYRGRSPQVGWQRVFGGQVVAQALVAAARTVPDTPIHSLHGYFLIGGDPKIPIIYEVDRIRDGRSYVTRRVVAIQHGKAIFSMSASFHRPEDGYDHQFPMPEVPGPDDLPTQEELRDIYRHDTPETVRKFLERRRALEMRPVDFRHYISADSLPPHQNIWFRAAEALPDDPIVHAAVLAYASDMTLLDTALFAHGKSVFDPDMALASLDHAIWFHRPLKADDWMLYAQDSPTASGGRGYTRGSIYSRSGVLVASTSQEGMIRRKFVTE
jgi:acyl-CoA thioesterase-2